MANQEITVRGEEAAAALRRLQQELASFPTAAQLRHTRGQGIGATSQFNSSVERAAEELSKLVEITRLDLANAHEAIEQTVAALIANDESLAADATLFAAALENIATPATTSNQSGHAAGVASPPTATTGMG
jgi:hypothetical protein